MSAPESFDLLSDADALADALRATVLYAYDHGYHEHGVPLVDTYKAALLADCVGRAGATDRARAGGDTERLDWLERSPKATATVSWSPRRGLAARRWYVLYGTITGDKDVRGTGDSLRAAIDAAMAAARPPGEEGGPEARMADATSETPRCPCCGELATLAEPLVLGGKVKCWCPNAHSWCAPVAEANDD